MVNVPSAIATIMKYFPSATSMLCWNCFRNVAIIGSIASNVMAEEVKDYVPKPHEFPPPNSAQYFAGELVIVDPINRRGAIRLDGDKKNGELSAERYYHGDPLRFAMLPYGSIWYHGAPAELRDIPIGTHLHGYFYLPPEGDKSIPPPQGPPHLVPKQNHAILLQDDFSFYSRRGQAWRIVSVDLKAGKLKVASTGNTTADGLKGEHTLELDRATRVWKGRGFATLEDLASEQVVQIGLDWDPAWGDLHFHCVDVWIDKESLDAATERQRQAHLRYQRYHWLAGWVDHVEQEPGGPAIVTVTLFDGIDPTLCDEVRAKAITQGFFIAVAEKTLRIYLYADDYTGGAVSGTGVEVKQIENPPAGSSGIQLRIRVPLTLEGFRPGRIVRVRLSDWPNIRQLAPEERAKSPDD
jgi:hypothetical protein